MLMFTPWARRTSEDLVFLGPGRELLEVPLDDVLRALFDAMFWCRRSRAEVAALVKEASGSTDDEEVASFVSDLEAQAILISGDPFAGYEDVRGYTFSRDFVPAVTETYLKAAIALRRPFRVASDGGGLQVWRTDDRCDEPVVIYEAWVQGESREAQALALDKLATLENLLRHGIPVPRSRRLAQGDIEAAWSLVREKPGAFVIKPVEGLLGLGVTVGVATREDVRHAMDVVAQVAAAHAFATSDVLVEERVLGNDYRILCTGGGVHAIVRRNRPVVVADGRRTILELVLAANEDPRRDRYFRPIELQPEHDFALGTQGLARDSIPEAGRTVTLSFVANLTRGATADDVTDEASPALRAFFEKAFAATGLTLAGIDYMAPNLVDPPEVSGGKVLEVNAQPGPLSWDPGGFMKHFAAREILEHLLMSAR